MQLLCFTRLPERLDIQIAITSSRIRKKIILIMKPVTTNGESPHGKLLKFGS